MRWTRFSSPLAIATALALSACSSTPADTAARAPVTLSSEQVTLEGSITRVDRANRMVTIRGSEGAELDLFVGDDVRNFDRLQVGDRVSLDYHRAIAAAIEPAPAGRRWMVTASSVSEAPTVETAVPPSSSGRS